MWEGKITQFGLTTIVYRQPINVTTARVFSDPPMNFLSVTKSKKIITFAEGQTTPAAGAFAGLADGNYVAGFRPNHLELRKNASDTIEFTGKLQVTEITGSETFIHLDHHGENWVGLIHGVKNLPIGAALDVYLDPCHIYVFAEDGSSVAPASYASAA